MTWLRGSWLVLGFSFVGLVVYLSLTSDPLDIPMWLPFKIGHVMAYAWLMWWFAQAIRQVRARTSLAVALLGMGVLLEYVQGMTGYRYFSYSDMRDDALGIAVGWALALGPAGSILDVAERRLAKEIPS